jgi:hypothetical protein
MSGIFISYRRASSSAVTYRLVDELKERFGEDALFFDAESIDPGVPFDQAIQSALSKCTIALIIIGPTWISIADDDGKRRLDNAEDWVRREVNAAINSRARVIPVLVEGANIPATNELPANIQELSRLQAFTFAKSPEYWDFDVQRLEKSLRKVDKNLPNPKPKSDDDIKKITKPSFSKKVIAGYVLAAFTAAGFYEDGQTSDLIATYAVFFAVAGVLHLLGFLDINKGLTTGKGSAITGMALSALLMLGAIQNYSTAQFATYEPPPVAMSDVPIDTPIADSREPIPESTADEDTPEPAYSPPDPVDDYEPPAPANVLQNVPQIAGVWVGDQGATYQFQQFGEEFRFTEFNVFGVQVGSASGYLLAGIFHFDYTNTLLNVSMAGQMSLDPASGLLYGSLTNVATAQQFPFQLHR